MVLGIIGTALAQVYIIFKQHVNANVALDTNKLVNGQHGKALDTIVTQAKQIATIAPSVESERNLADAKKAVSDHAIKGQ
jgi:hypothetical protein